MDWSELLLNDYSRDVEQVNKRLRSEIGLRNASSLRMRERFEALEEENCRLALMLRAVMELCVRKGVMTREEIGQTIEEVDLWDGVQDGRYGRPPLRDDAGGEMNSTHAFLEELERRADTGNGQDDADVRDFLDGMGDSENSDES